MVLPEPRSFDGGPPTAGAWPSLGAAARLLLGLLRGPLLGRWRSDFWAGAWLAFGPRRGPWLGWRSDHRGGCSWLALGPLRGRCAAAGSERAKRSCRLGQWLSSAAYVMLTGAGTGRQPCAPSRLPVCLQYLPAAEPNGEPPASGLGKAQFAESPGPRAEQDGGTRSRRQRPTPSPGAGRQLDHSPGLLAGAADPVLLFLLVEAAAFTDAVLAVHDLAFGIEEGERRAAMYAEVLGELLVLGESGALLNRFLTHLTGKNSDGGRGDIKQHISKEVSTPGAHPWPLAGPSSHPGLSSILNLGQFPAQLYRKALLNKLPFLK